MTLYFAYGSNMCRDQMGLRCPGAVALGTARLDHWRFAITRNGYATIKPSQGDRVHGVLWKVTTRHLHTLNAYECLDSGWYRRGSVAVRLTGGTRRALVYVGGSTGSASPLPGYQDGIIVPAAIRAGLPAAYIRELERFIVTGWRAPGPMETKQANARRTDQAMSWVAQKTNAFWVNAQRPLAATE
jgi:gamma-glutamylcyclotransferase (GGCT)/AIG2-like uncharacterized protein YtfP